MTNENNYNWIHEILNFYIKKGISLHITFKSGQWVNGRVISVGKDRLIFDDERFGEMLVLFERIKEDGIEPREEKK